MKFTIQVHPFLVIITIYFICLIDALKYEKGSERDNAFSQYDPYGHFPAQEPLPRGS